MDIIVHRINNRKTIKRMVKFRMKHGHKPLPTKVWEEVYMDIGEPKELIAPHILLGNCESGQVFIIEGPGIMSAEHVIKLPMSEIVKLPQEVQEIIFFARKSGEYNKTVTFRMGKFSPSGGVQLWKIGEV